MTLKFRTKAACRIAGISAQRFNELVADGTYECAPATKAGAARVFEEADIAGLLVFGHMMRVFSDHRFSSKIAVIYACGLVEVFRRHGDTLPARADFPLDGFNDVAVECEDDEPPAYSAYEGVRAPSATICFDLHEIRKAVRRGMREEAQILGEED